MTWGMTALIAGSTIIGAGTSLIAADKAAGAQESAADTASRTQLQMSREAIQANERALERIIELNEPFREAGLKALDQYVAEIGAGAPTFSEFVQSPEAAAIREAELADITKAVERSAAARGNLFAPSTTQALQDEALKKTASSKLGQYEMSLQRRQSDINNIGNIVNVGQGATMQDVQAIGERTGQTAGILQNTGLAQANIATQAGNARASGYINQANAITGAISSGTSNYILAKYLKNLKPAGGENVITYT
jgi:hypothetical protein